MWKFGALASTKLGTGKQEDLPRKFKVRDTLFLLINRTREELCVLSLDQSTAFNIHNRHFRR